MRYTASLFSAICVSALTALLQLHPADTDAP